MGKSVSPWIRSCNGFIRVELDSQRTSSDSGALLLREALDNSGFIEALEDNLVDQRDQLRIRHSLASQLRTLVLKRAMGWIDLSDSDTLRHDPLWQLACSDARGRTSLGSRAAISSHTVAAADVPWAQRQHRCRTRRPVAPGGLVSDLAGE